MLQGQVTLISSGSLEIIRAWCKGCSLCVSVCTKGAISVDELGKVRVVNPEICSGCGMCESFCPDFAIRVNKNV